MLFMDLNYIRHAFEASGAKQFGWTSYLIFLGSCSSCADEVDSFLIVADLMEMIIFK